MAVSGHLRKPGGLAIRLWMWCLLFYLCTFPGARKVPQPTGLAVVPASWLGSAVPTADVIEIAGLPGVEVLTLLIQSEHMHLDG